MNFISPPFVQEVTDLSKQAETRLSKCRGQGFMLLPSKQADASAKQQQPPAPLTVKGSRSQTPCQAAEHPTEKRFTCFLGDNDPSWGSQRLI